MATGKAIIATQKTDDYIIKHYPTTRAKVISKSLGLSVKYVQNRAWFLNVRKIKTSKKIEVEEIQAVDMRPAWKPKIIINGAVLRHVAY